jgi:2-succinyl-5-enolpyruvyl-6-hydroxy-3-cyclohexene-1-carboxylate synthase
MPPRYGLHVISNRGLAGIDGNTSTAVGAALAHQEFGRGPAYAIVGDLTFLHDATGLITCARDAGPDLTIIVINNRGGGIFSLVGHTADAIGFDDIFAMPHTVDIAGLAAATGWRHTEIVTPSQLIASLDGHGPRVLEVRTNRDINAKLHHRIKQHLGQVLDQELSELDRLRPRWGTECMSRA